MGQGTIDRDELAKYLAGTLDITRFRDFCPNGLQVEGRKQIKTPVSYTHLTLPTICSG